MVVRVNNNGGVVTTLELLQLVDGSNFLRPIFYSKLFTMHTDGQDPAGYYLTLPVLEGFCRSVKKLEGASTKNITCTTLQPLTMGPGHAGMLYRQ